MKQSYISEVDYKTIGLVIFLTVMIAVPTTILLTLFLSKDMVIVDFSVDEGFYYNEYDNKSSILGYYEEGSNPPYSSAIIDENQFFGEHINISETVSINEVWLWMNPDTNGFINISIWNCIWNESYEYAMPHTMLERGDYTVSQILDGMNTEGVGTYYYIKIPINYTLDPAETEANAFFFGFQISNFSAYNIALQSGYDSRNGALKKVGDHWVNYTTGFFDEYNHLKFMCMIPKPKALLSEESPTVLSVSYRAYLDTENPKVTTTVCPSSISFTDLFSGETPDLDDVTGITGIHYQEKFYVNEEMTFSEYLTVFAVNKTSGESLWYGPAYDRRNRRNETLTLWDQTNQLGVTTHDGFIDFPMNSENIIKIIGINVYERDFEVTRKEIVLLINGCNHSVSYDTGFDMG